MGNERKTPLHYAIVLGHNDIVQQLIEQCNVNIHARDRNGLTPLHTAAIHYEYLIVVWLLRRGANPNAQDQRGNTPLHYAYDKWIISHKLLQHGADKHIENNDHQTYIDLKRRHLVVRDLSGETIKANSTLFNSQ